MITQARYNTPEEVSIAVTYDNGREVTMPSYPSGTHYDRDMEIFLDGGGTIDPYDPYYGMSLDEVKEEGYTFVDAEEANYVDAAQHNPSIGTVLTDSDTIRANKKRDNQAKKKNNGISDADDHLLDYIDEVDDFAETLRDQMEACGDTACVDAVIASIPTAAWPVWVPE